MFIYYTEVDRVLRVLGKTECLLFMGHVGVKP